MLSGGPFPIILTRGIIMHFLNTLCCKRTGSAVRGIIVVAILMAGAACLLLPKYFALLEKNASLSMQAMLVNISIAEEKYYAKHQHYTENWAYLLPSVAMPASLQVVSRPMENRTHFFGFGNRAKHKKDGFIVSVSVDPDGQQGIVTARRTGNVRYQYTLQREFPFGDAPSCDPASRAARTLCKNFQETAAMLELKNLVPISESEEEPSAQ